MEYQDPLERFKNIDCETNRNMPPERGPEIVRDVDDPERTPVHSRTFRQVAD